MRFLIIALAFLTMAAQPGFAGFVGFDSSGVNLGAFTKLACSTNLACTKTGGKFRVAISGDVAGDGTDQLYGYLQNQVASSTTTLTAAQCGSTIVSNSADVVTLPEASTVLGCQYTFVCGTADDFDVNPNDGTDQIGVVNSVAGGTGAAITPAAGDAIRCTDIGSSITLEAVGANLWSAIGVGNGAWTDVN